MAIVLRGNKNTPLTHTELDNNFRQFFYSASVSGTSLSLFTTASLDNEINIPLSTPSGFDYYVQFKEGNAPSGSDSNFSGSRNLIYDYRQNHLKHTGSFTNVGDVTIDGILTAQQYNTQLISASVIYESGSTIFGNSLDDTHTFSGSIILEGSFTGSDISIRDWGSVSASLSTLGGSPAWDTLTGIPEGIISSSQQFPSSIVSSSTQITNLGFLSSLPGNIVSSSTQITNLGFLSSLPGNIISSSTQITNLGFLSSLPGGVVSGSTLSSPSQGTLRLTTNGVNGSNVDTGLQTGDSPTFAGLTINGSITSTGDITAYFSSDERLKDNIEVIPNAIDKIQQIKGVSWDWNSLSTHEGHDVGVIAQDIEKVLPELVVDRDTGFKAVRYDKIVALLIEGIKEQQGQINELRSEIQLLKGQ